MPVRHYFQCTSSVTKNAAAAYHAEEDVHAAQSHRREKMCTRKGRKKIEEEKGGKDGRQRDRDG